MRGITINAHTEYSHSIEVFGGSLAIDQSTIGSGSVAAIYEYNASVYCESSVPIRRTHPGNAPRKLFDYNTDGTWAPEGTKNIYGINQYQVFMAFHQGAATGMIGFRVGNNIRFIGGNLTTNLTTAAMNITLSGIAATLASSAIMTHTASGQHSALSGQNVGQLWGIC